MRLLPGPRVARALVGVGALGVIVTAGALAAAPSAVNGTWIGTTTQHEPITLTVSRHRVTYITGTIRLRNPRTSQVDGCPSRTLFTAQLSSGADGHQQSTHSGFLLRISAQAMATGRVTSARLITGTVAFDPGRATPRCAATTTFTAHPG